MQLSAVLPFIVQEVKRGKRSPSSPPEKETPSKKPNMSSPTPSPIPDSDPNSGVNPLGGNPKNDTGHNDTGDNNELSPELAKLRELLNRDMETMIEPLKTDLSALKTSQKALEEKGGIIDTIKCENHKLRTDYNLIRKENEDLKNRITAIESKLIENNIVLHGIEDQAWELTDVTREKNSADHIQHSERKVKQREARYCQKDPNKEHKVNWGI